MGKVYLKATLNPDDENLFIETEGIKTNNKIVYKENNITVVLKLYDNEILMNRTCNEYSISFIFKKDAINTSKYSLYGGSKVFILNTKTTKLIIDKDKILIDYELEGNKFSYILEMEGL